MNLLSLKSLIILTGILLSSMRVSAQSNKSDSVFYESAVNNAIAIYRQSTSDQPRFYNGRKYKPYRIGFINEVPFFQNDQFTEGTLIYEGSYYDKVKLLFDEVKDMVIIKTDVAAIELINERVGGFSFPGHTFLRLTRDSSNDNFNTGYYEKLYSGKIEIYKKEIKEIKENISSTEGVRGEIIKKTWYYLKKNGVYYLIKKKKHINQILSNHKNDIQKFVRNNGLSFRNDADNTLIQIGRFYDQLTP